MRLLCLTLLTLLTLLIGCAEATPSSSDLGAAPDAEGVIPPIDTSACVGGVAPTLDRCDAGVFDADCGGDGEPVLACRNGTHCKWFVHGCPAEGFRPIACPLGDPYCVDTPDGRWPYATGVESATSPADMCDQLDLIGDAVVTPTSGPLIDVRIDPAFTAPDQVELTCAGVDVSLCDSAVMRGSTHGVFPVDREVFGFRPLTLFGEDVLFELVRNADGNLAARGWVLRFTDAWSGGEDCSRYDSRDGSSDRPIVDHGELILQAEPDGATELHGAITMVMVDGGTMSIRF